MLITPGKPRTCSPCGPPVDDGPITQTSSPRARSAWDTCIALRLTPPSSARSYGTTVQIFTALFCDGAQDRRSDGDGQRLLALGEEIDARRRDLLARAAIAIEVRHGTRETLPVGQDLVGGVEDPRGLEARQDADARLDRLGPL